MCDLCMNKVGVAGGGSGQGGVAACSFALVKIVKSSGDRCVKACRHKSRTGLSVGTLVSNCSE